MDYQTEQDIMTILNDMTIYSTIFSGSTAPYIGLDVYVRGQRICSSIINLPGSEENIKLQGELDHARKVVNFYKDEVERLLDRVSLLEKRLSVGIEENQVLVDIQE